MAAYEHVNHLIGDLEYDADMNVVESFVRARIHPEDTLAQTAVHTYYISRILDYWSKAMEYLRSEQFKKDVDSTPEWAFTFDVSRDSIRGIYSPEQIEEYYQYLTQTVNSLNQNFNRTQQLDIPAINVAFHFLSKIACASQNPYEIMSRNLQRSNNYILPNEIGLFGLNTYLYAYFEKILLVGIPIRLTRFDRSRGCSHQFLDHDLVHNYTIENDLEIMEDTFSDGKNFYYTILNDANLTIHQKQCIILIIWIGIHEFSIGPLDENLSEPNFVVTLDESARKMISSSLKGEFDGEMSKFSTFLFSEANIRSLLELFRRFEQFPEYPGWLSSTSSRDENVRGAKRIRSLTPIIESLYINRNNLETYFKSRSDKWYLHYLMAYWFYYRYMDGYKLSNGLE